MNKRQEDQIIELAFGDRSETSAAELSASPESAARLKEYRTMRSALGQLRELPEHQLSTERLREALLHRGLKRRRAFPWQALGYSSVAASLFLCSYVISRNVRRANAQDPTLRITAEKPDSGALQFPESFFKSGAVADRTQPVAEKTLGNQLHRAPVATHEFPSGDLAVNLGGGRELASASRLAAYAGNVAKPGAKSSDARSGPIVLPIADASTPSKSMSLSNAMVLIQPQTDANTGLDTAKEVSATGDVLVGG